MIMVALQFMISVLEAMELIDSEKFFTCQLTNAKVRAAPRVSRWEFFARDVMPVRAGYS